MAVKHLTIPDLTPKELSQFFRKVDIQEIGCWPWEGYRDEDGYGRFGLRGRPYRAPRVAYKIYNGCDPGELNVCHTCDYPPCVRLDHLFLGTPLDNMADKIAKGRSGYERRHSKHHSKSHPDYIAEIRQRLSKGELPSHIAQAVGVHRTTVSRIKNGETWRLHNDESS